MNKYIITLSVFLISIYFGLFFMSFSGWGYSGHGGYYYRSPSFWYFGGASHYPNKSMRSGSLGGRGTGGGGFHSGK